MVSLNLVKLGETRCARRRVCTLTYSHALPRLERNREIDDRGRHGTHGRHAGENGEKDVCELHFVDV